MLKRSVWKKMRELNVGLPPGVQVPCECGGLLIFESRAGEGSVQVIVHHTMPACVAYNTKVAPQAEFHVLSAALTSDVEEALRKAKEQGGG